MKRTIALASVLLVGLLGGSAQASTMIESGNPIYQQWVDRARVATPDVTLTVVEEPCPYTSYESYGCTDTDRKIWLDYDHVFRFDPRKTFYHELGHHYVWEVEDWGWPNVERQVEAYAVCAMWWRVPYGSRVAGLTRRSQHEACLRLRGLALTLRATQLVAAPTGPPWRCRSVRDRADPHRC